MPSFDADTTCNAAVIIVGAAAVIVGAVVVGAARNFAAETQLVCALKDTRVCRAGSSGAAKEVPGQTAAAAVPAAKFRLPPSVATKFRLAGS